MDWNWRSGLPGLDYIGSNPIRGKSYVSSLKRPDQLTLSAHRTVGSGVCFPRINPRVRDVDLLHPSIAEVKNEWSCTPIPPICLHGVDRDTFTSRSEWV